MSEKNTNKQTIAYAARIKDRSVLLKSSSGGIFTAISDYAFSQGYAIACSAYNYKKQQIEYILLTDNNKRDEARGSKYIQSIPGNIYSESLRWLKNNPEKMLVFIGMGCQAAGFKKFTHVNRLDSRVFVVDIICHGSPSPMIWRDYVKSLEKKRSSSITAVNFKDKRNGWRSPTAVALVNGKEISLRNYIKLFYNRCALRPSCHKCPYATTERNTDMTIGDYWGIDEVMPEFYDSMGNSLILLHSRRGEVLFDAIKEFLYYKKSRLEDCLQPNLIKPTLVSDKRDQFWHDYYKHGINFIVKKYAEVNFLNKLKNMIIKIS